MGRCKLEEFISYEQPTKYIVDSDQYDDSYKIPVLTAGKSFILGYTDEKNNIFDNLPVIIFDDFTTSVQFVDFPFKVKSSAMKLLKNTEQADIKYCYYLLKFLQHTPENHKRQWLSATSQNIVELPIIEKQKNIVRKLDKILEVIDNQNKQLELLDEAIKARFVEMFGDENNSKGWEIVNIEDVANVQVGVVIKPSQYYTDQYNGIKAFRSLNIGDGYIKDDDWVYFSKEGNKKNKKSILSTNDVLVVRSGAPGTACVVTSEYAGSNAIDVIIAHPDFQKVDSRYLCTYTNMPHGKSQIIEGTGGAAQQHFNVGKYNKLKLMLPPLEYQKQYVKFLEEIDKSRSRIQKSLEASQELFDSLMQEYFG